MVKFEFGAIKYGKKVILEGGLIEAQVGITFIKGENGTGKTSLLNSIYGLNNTVVSAKMAGFEINLNNEEYRSKYISYLTQSNNMFEDLTIMDNIQIIDGDYDTQLFKDLVRVLNIKKIVKQNPKFKKLSGGEKQKVKILSILLKNTPIVLLDEPFNNLDNESIGQLIDYLINQKKYLILTSHLPINGIDTEYIIKDSIISLKNKAVDIDTKELKVEEKLKLELDKRKLKEVSKSNKNTRMTLYAINSFVICIFIIAFLSTLGIFRQATVDRSNFIFSDTATLLTSPIYNSYFTTFGNEKWLEKIPTYFTEEDVKKLEELDYVKKVIPTKNRAYDLGGITYNGMYMLDTELLGEEFTFSTALYSKDVAQNIPSTYFPTNDGQIQEMIVGEYSDDKSNEVIIDTLMADYIIENSKYSNYDNLINQVIEVPVINVEDNTRSELPFKISGVFQPMINPNENETYGTIVTSFDENNSYIQRTYSQYQDKEIQLDNIKNRLASMGLDEDLINSDLIPQVGYDTLYVEVNSKNDLERLTEAVTSYDQYIEIENNYVNSQTVNFRYLNKLLIKNVIICIFILIMYIITLFYIFKIFIKGININQRKLDFYGYDVNTLGEYIAYEQNEYILNTLVINMILTIIVQYIIYNNFSVIILLTVNLILQLLNISIIKYLVRNSSESCLK